VFGRTPPVRALDRLQMLGGSACADGCFSDETIGYTPIGGRFWALHTYAGGVSGY